MGVSDAATCQMSQPPGLQLLMSPVPHSLSASQYSPTWIRGALLQLGVCPEKPRETVLAVAHSEAGMGRRHTVTCGLAHGIVP